MFRQHIQRSALAAAAIAFVACAVAPNATRACIADSPSCVKKLAGNAVDLKALRRVRFLFLLGEADTNDAAEYTNNAAKYHDSYSDADAKLINRLYGETLVKRWGQAERLYHAAGVNARFKLYPGVGHEMTPVMWNDLMDTFRKALSAH